MPTLSLWGRRLTRFLALSISASASAATLPAGFQEQTFSGISNPVNLAVAPDGRVFVSQKCGAIRVIKNNVLLSTPFASLSVNCTNERGAHGIAFDPNFATNGFVYVRYTRASPQNNVIGRLRASAPGSDVSDGTVAVIFTIPYDGNIYHHGGGLQVGNDGKLYSSIGDHQTHDGQNMTNVWGKVIRINIPDGSIPNDNPFLGTTTGINQAIWAYGFRNPFTLDIQPVTGRIFVNDVGDGSGSCCEEVNELRRAGNYGWDNNIGGSSAYFTYIASNQGGNAITGGDFYNPQTVMFPAQYVGRYFFADYGGDWIRSISATAPPGSLQGFASGIAGPTDVEVHPDGSMYYAAHDGSVVRRITFGTPTPTPTPTPTGPPPLTPTPTPTARPNGTPVPTISAPPEGTLYAGGDLVSFAGDCTDPEDGVVPAARCLWEIIFHHNTHTHPGYTFPGVKGGSFQIPNDAEWDPDQWWRICLTCTDSSGQSRTVCRDVRPRTQTLTLASSPTGLQVAADSVSGAAPLSMPAIVNAKRVLTTAAPQMMGGTTYYFEKWSDGGARRHDIFMPGAPTTYTATFKPTSAYTDLTPPASGVTASTSDANVPGNTVDNNLATRWSGDGDGTWIRYDLGSTKTVGHVGVAVYNGNARRNRFELQVSTDNATWMPVFNGESSGTTTAEETYDFADVPARYVRYFGHGNIGATNPTINSVTEVSIFGTAVPLNTIVIGSMTYTPSTLTVDPGTTVTWFNGDTMAHTATADDSSWDSGTIDPGGSFSRVFDTAGPNPYHCSFHPGMTGTVIVNGTPTPTPTPTPVTPTPTPTPTPVTPTPTPTPTSTPITPTPTPTATDVPAEYVEASPVTATASTSDTNLPANAVDNSLATRWSGNGDGAYLQIDLGSVKTVGYVTVAAYVGNMRFNRFDLAVLYGSLETGAWKTVLAGAQTSGTTTQEELFDFPDETVRYIRYIGHGNSDPTKCCWNSVTEMSVYVATVVTPTPTPTPTPTLALTPTPTPTPPCVEIIIPPCGGGVCPVTASTDDGNVPGNVIDNSLATRWSANGDGQWVRIDLGSPKTICSISVAVYNGNSRRNRFDLQASLDASVWTNLATNVLSSGTTTAEEVYEFAPVVARYIRYLGHMSTVNTFNSVTEISVFGGACESCPTPTPTPLRPTPTPTPTPPPGGKVKWAGVRSSGYGISPFPSPAGWTNAMTTMAGYFPGSTPVGYWLVGEIFFAGTNSGQGLEFPNPGGSWDSRIQFQATDKHESYLDYFDTHGVKVFLQFEPGFAPLDQLFQVTYNRYGHHPSVIGFGVDVEWYHSTGDGAGNDNATDSVVQAWNTKVKSLNPSYRLFVKHYDRTNLPPTLRGDIIFVDDSEQNGSYSGFLAEMKGFADFFNPAHVGYQIGYPSDRGWWSTLATPIPKTIGDRLVFQTLQSECSIAWVDFSLREVLPTN